MINQKILVVEDDNVLREVLTEKLRKTGYEAIQAEDGEEAMEIIRKDKPALILLDILMPRKGGMEVMEDLAADPDLHKIPVIVISNSGQPVEVKRARELGARDFLIKAVFDPNEVLDKVNKILQEESLQIGGGEVEDSKSDAVVDISPTHEEAPEDIQEVDNLVESNGTEGNPKRGKVLVVEDDKFLRELFVRKLFTEGFEVDSAIDAGEVFEILAEKKPEVILLDLILPGIDGFEILATIKKDQKLKNIPVMVISNLGQKEDVDRAMELGAVDFLVKANFTLDEIIARVLIVLRGD